MRSLHLCRLRKVIVTRVSVSATLVAVPVAPTSVPVSLVELVKSSFWFQLLELLSMFLLGLLMIKLVDPLFRFLKYIEDTLFRFLKSLFSFLVFVLLALVLMLTWRRILSLVCGSSQVTVHVRDKERREISR